MNNIDRKPLAGLTVLEFSQFLAGPVAGLRLSDLGARVIKIEKPEVGDLCRYIYLSDTNLSGDNSLFHAINRNKESFVADLKKPEDLNKVKNLISQANIITQNFRPGVIERIGLDYETVKKINPKIVYGSITGYGDKGPWKNLPGQDLLAQSRSGLVWLNGSGKDSPTPMGLAAADMFAGHYLVQGILAGVIKSLKTGEGSHVQTSLMEAMLDFQFEVLTTYLNNGKRKPQRSNYNNAHAYLAAPYGIYKTKDAYIALSMTPIPSLGELIKLDSIKKFTDKNDWFVKRDEIKELIGNHMITNSTQHWLDILQPADVWCSEVLEWNQMLDHEGFKVIDMLQRIRRLDGLDIETLRCPIRFNDTIFKSDIAAPKIGQHTYDIEKEFNL
ncbi:CoA transferase [Alphaproteobacteria bacterium]|nr:CoA transferase [Alphaproteobacteria bacterium]